MENGKGQTIFLSVIGIATLLVAIVGATFAWFSATITGNEEASSVYVQAATLGITFTDGQEINLDKVAPGATDTKTFTVAADASATIAQTYTINFDVTANSFEQNELVYTLDGTGDGAVADIAETAVPAVGTNALGNGTLATGATHSYTMVVTFKEMSSEQNYNQGKIFAGAIQVVSGNISAS